jgi:hypothetical protein
MVKPVSKSARLKGARQASHRLALRANEIAADEGRERGCLICRENDGGFASVEHILPESLGNTEMLLPRGVVCDRCNHGPLSRLDQALAGFLPIEMMRTWHGVPARAAAFQRWSSTTGPWKPGRRGMSIYS